MTNFDNVAPLADCLPLCSRETALSYVSRLAPYFGCQSTYQFCKDFDLDLSKLMDGNEDTLKRLSRLTNADFSELRRWSAITQSGGRKSINGQVLTHSRSSRRTMAFCPLCASEDIAANPKVTADLAVYVRAEWQASDIRHCGAHWVPLLRYAVDDRRSRSDLGNFIGQFMADYDSAATVGSVVGDMETYLLARLLGGDRSPVVHLDGLELSQIVSLSRSLGAAMANEVRQFEDLEVRRVDELGAMGFSALLGGQETILFACRDIRLNHWKDRANGCLKRVERFFKRCPRTEAVERISRIIATAAFATFPYREGEQFCGVTCERAIVQHSRMAMETLGLTKSIWLELVSTKPSWVVYQDDQPRHTLIDIAAARSFLKEYVPSSALPDMAATHGLSSQQLQHMQLGGFIKPATFNDIPEMVGLYPRSHVEEAMLAAREIHTLAANDNEVPAGYLNLVQVSKIHAIEIQLLLNAIFAGELHCVRTPAGRNPNFSAWVDPMEAIKKTLGFKSPMTLQEVSDFLRLHFSKVSILAQNGILPSRSRPRGNGVVITFEREDVEAFSAKYVTTSEVMEKRLKIPWSVYPLEVTHPSWKTPPVRIYERADLSAPNRRYIR